MAVITGPSKIHIGNTLLTLDASKSFNPNEKDQTKNLIYTWECNVVEDKMCKQFTTTGTNYYLFYYFTNNII